MTTIQWVAVSCLVGSALLPGARTRNLANVWVLVRILLMVLLGP
jgi:hypothetical protein